jgi:hypothetical protein
MSNLKEIKREPRNKDAVELLEALLTRVREEDDATEVLMFVKIGEDYHRFATPLEDLARLTGVLEMAKFDVLRRMVE